MPLFSVICALFASFISRIPRSVSKVPEGVSLCLSKRQLKRSFAKRSEEHTSELQSQSNLVCRLLLEKKKYAAVTTPSNARSVRTNRTLLFSMVTPFIDGCALSGLHSQPLMSIARVETQWRSIHRASSAKRSGVNDRLASVEFKGHETECSVKQAATVFLHYQRVFPAEIDSGGRGRFNDEQSLFFFF